jgi:hypothetical protein
MTNRRGSLLEAIDEEKEAGQPNKKKPDTKLKGTLLWFFNLSHDGITYNHFSSLKDHSKKFKADWPHHKKKKKMEPWAQADIPLSRPRQKFDQNFGWHFGCHAGRFDAKDSKLWQQILFERWLLFKTHECLCRVINEGMEETAAAINVVVSLLTKVFYHCLRKWHFPLVDQYYNMSPPSPFTGLLQNYLWMLVVTFIAIPKVLKSPEQFVNNPPPE